MSQLLSKTGMPAARNPSWPPEVVELLARVDRLLRNDRPQEALGLLAGADTPWTRNARGVCLLRLGRTSQAINALRDLVFCPSGFAIRPDAETLFQANYATALLLDGHTDGFHSILAGIRDRAHPAVARLDDAIRRWKAGMSVWQRIGSILGTGGPRLTLDFPPGSL
jgi:hypothetical protein